MKQILHKPHGKNQFCGPTALSAITGLSTDDISAMVRTFTDQRSVKGMRDWQVQRVLQMVGGKAEHIAFGGFGALGKATLQQWMDARVEGLRSKVLLVTAGNHYMVVRGDLVLCGQSGRDWVHILSHPFRRKVFQEAMLITPPPAKAKLPPAVTKKRAYAKANSQANSAVRRRAQRLANALGLKVEHYQDDAYDISVVDEDRYRPLLEREGLLVDGESIDDCMAELFDSMTAYGWHDVHDRLLEIDGRIDP